MLILPACGDEQTATAVDRPVVSHRPGRLATASVDRRCRRSLADLLDAMESLNNTVTVGTTYDGYLSGVNHVRAAYAESEAKRLPLVCLASVAAPAERALNA